MSGRKRDEDLPEELDFGEDRAGSRRIGDRRPYDEVQEEFPPSRVREAGLTGGSSLDGGVTADDLSPETLLDDQLSRSPSDLDRREAIDTQLREVGENEIGAGFGASEEDFNGYEEEDEEENGEYRDEAGNDGDAPGPRS